MAIALVIKDADFSENAVGTITFDGVHTTGITLDSATLSLESIGATATLTATLTPADSEDPILWTSSDTSIATVTNAGVVTSVAVGSCTITATSGSYSATCAVTVTISTYLSGTTLTKTLVDPNGSGNNAMTRIWCDIGTTSTTYGDYISLLTGNNTYTGDLLCGTMAVNVAKSGYDFQIVTDPADMDGNMLRTYNAIGYPMPIAIPSGATKLRCIGLSDQYGAHPLFFDSTTRALSTNENVNGGQYYVAFRQKYTPSAADYTWSYENNLEFDIPDGYDSVVVVWKTNPNDSTAISPVDMTAEQLAEFKVLCM